MLDTIREYATEQLTEAGEIDELRRRHAHYYTALAIEAKPHLVRAEVRTWLDRLDAEVNNLRAALGWALEGEDVETAQRLVGSLWRYWQMRGHVAEGREHANEALRLEGASPRTRIDALEAAGGLAYWQMDLEGTADAYGEALSLAEETGDQALIAIALYNMAFGQFLGSSEERVMDLFSRSLEIARKIDDPDLTPIALWGMASGYLLHGRYEHALPIYTEALRAAREVGNRYIEGWGHRMRGVARLELGDLGGARQDFSSGLQIFSSAGDMSALALHVRDFAVLALLEGEDERALLLAGAVAQIETVSETRMIQFLNNQLQSTGETPVSLRDAIARVGEDRANTLISRGRTMSADEAVAYALQD